AHLRVSARERSVRHKVGCGKQGACVNIQSGNLPRRNGAPPHGGLGIGLDRLVMVMLQAESLRDVTAFPKVQNASELMSACPSAVDKESLDVLGISVNEKEAE
ncbi:MAG: hypothetical protein IJ939_05390, partial [Clostridia bacterium]|nr:hypothetical protein [Clostridia bacterium]